MHASARQENHASGCPGLCIRIKCPANPSSDQKNCLYLLTTQSCQVARRSIFGRLIRQSRLLNTGWLDAMTWVGVAQIWGMVKSQRNRIRPNYVQNVRRGTLMVIGEEKKIKGMSEDGGQKMVIYIYSSLKHYWRQIRMDIKNRSVLLKPDTLLCRFHIRYNLLIVNWPLVSNIRIFFRNSDKCQWGICDYSGLFSRTAHRVDVPDPFVFLFFPFRDLRLYATL